MSTTTDEPLTGVRKAAILCMALGTEAASRILQQLSPDEVQRVTEEIARIPTVGRDVIAQVLGEYRDAVRAAGEVADGGLPAAQTLLEATLGPERARHAVERIATPPAEGGMPALARTSPAALIGILRGEQPQTIALVLAHVDPALASGVIEALPSELATAVLFRMARMQPVLPEILTQVEQALGARAALSLATPSATSGGPATVARLLNRVRGGLDKTLLEELATREQALADEVRELMFVFEDLQLLDDRSMQRLLRDVPGRDLALALKAASEPLKARVFKNMSERAVETLREEMEMLGAVKVKDVQGAHAEILALARGLQEAGEITIDRGTDDDTIA
ncbi:MAG: flagellar motor switch protein FliG [Gemmatimonadetes bacterium]|nr:flagellar motor switch protein FliG [Gemmatimonadota bacterium]MCB9518990.1 flagellar motor switch protein FliG [Gemmatimonadales bacterium]